MLAGKKGHGEIYQRREKDFVLLASGSLFRMHSIFWQQNRNIMTGAGFYCGSVSIRHLRFYGFATISETAGSGYEPAVYNVSIMWLI
jgi:hypothetical protein